MTDHPLAQSGEPKGVPRAGPLAEVAPLVEALFCTSNAAAWGISTARFQHALETGIRKRFAFMPATPAKLQEYLGTLHVQDLALACACAEGIEPAWEHFVATYRHYLYSAAAAIIRRPSDDPYVREFADSIYATLYGKSSGQIRSSLFEHFHGRSKLTTWLRAVLAQRYVDVIRREKKFDSLDDDSSLENKTIPPAKRAGEPQDPHRSQYLRCLADALQQAVAALPASDRARLYAYYFEERTLADIARQSQEHEATASRKLERLRGQLKQHVTDIMREGKTSQSGAARFGPMDDAQIQLCFQYAVEEWPFDLAGLLRFMKVARMPRTQAPEQTE